MRLNNNSILMILTFLIFSSCQTKEQQSIQNYEGKQFSFEEVDSFISQKMNSLKIPGISIAIINDGKVAYHRAFGVSNFDTKKKIDENSIFEAASLSKPLFSYFVLKLSEKGIIDLDRPLYFYLKDEAMERDQRYRQVTARMVLNHTTGFPNWRWFDELPADQNLERGDFFLKKDPATTFTYSGEAYQYLARVIAHLSFMNMNELSNLFQKEVAIPLQMKHAYFVWDDFLLEHKVFGHKKGKVNKRSWGAGLPNHNSKTFNAAGGLHTEAKSYANFLLEIMNIEKENPYYNMIEEMLTLHVELPKEDNNFKEDGITSWGLGVGIKPFGKDVLFTHGGSNSDFQSQFTFSRNKKIGYVFFTNCDKGKEFNKELEGFIFSLQVKAEEL